MNLPGLITVQPNQTDLIDSLAAMVGTCFLEEMWYITWLDALDTTEERKRAIMQDVIRADYVTTAPYGCVYTLSDHAGAANVFLHSDLGETGWEDIEEQSALRMAESLTPEELDILLPRAEAMEPLSDTTWPLEVAEPGDDFLYFISAGVDPNKRGSGAFGRLFTPFLTYADEHEIATYLDCYTDRLEQLYRHYGFETIDRKGAPGFDIVERCMVRRPR